MNAGSCAKSVRDLGQLLALDERSAVARHVLGRIGVVHAQVDKLLGDVDIGLGPDDGHVARVRDQAWRLGWLVDDALLWRLVWQPTVDDDLLWLSRAWWQVLVDDFASWWWDNLSWDLRLF